MRFRGREMMHKERGFDRMKHVTETLQDVARVDMPPKLAGRRITMILSPDKNKIDRIKASLESKAKNEKKAKDAEAPVESAPLEAADTAPVEAPEATAAEDTADA